MPPNNPYIALYLTHLIYYSLDNNILSNALFLATRLHAHEPRSPDASYLLSLCHLRLTQLDSAFEYSKRLAIEGQHLGCAYVYAQSCLGLGRFLEGINALEFCRPQWTGTNSWTGIPDKHSKTHRGPSPDAAAVFFLLGQLYEATKNTQKAVESYTKATQTNPLLWDAFTNLCDVGAKVNVNNIFEMPSYMAELSFTSEELPSSLNSMFKTSSQSKAAIPQPAKTSSDNDPFQTSSRHNIQGGLDEFEILGTSVENYSSLSQYAPVNGEAWSSKALEAPNRAVDLEDWKISPPFTPHDPKSAALKVRSSLFPPALEKPRTMSRMEKATRQQPPMMTTKAVEILVNEAPNNINKSSTSSTSGVDRKRTVSGQAVRSRDNPESMVSRRSTRLISQSRTTKNLSSYANETITKEGREMKQPKAPFSKRIGLNFVSSQESSRFPETLESTEGSHSTADPALKPVSAVLRSEISEKKRRQDGIEWLSGLLKRMGAGYFYLAQFQCQKALEMFTSIPSVQRETAWVLSNIARAYFEQASYAEAVQAFAKLRTTAPARVEDMDIYSTALWHLKRDVDLAFLSYELMDLDRLSPQTWCAIGNSFSLQRDHDNAVKCFKRASQLNSKFAYAFTLRGHEHVLNEEYDKAIHAYQCGIAAKHRHYNSWYGLGCVYQKLEKYDVAEKYFRIALKINPENAVLLGSVGMTLEKKGNLEDAMRYYNKVCSITPNSIFGHERKARIFIQQQDVNGALAELTLLKDLVPERSEIHILLGRLYSTKNEKGRAIRSYTTALGLNQIASSTIKDEIEALEQGDKANRDMSFPV